jgi:hypothetical protein
LLLSTPLSSTIGSTKLPFYAIFFNYRIHNIAPFYATFFNYQPTTLLLSMPLSLNIGSTILLLSTPYWIHNTVPCYVILDPQHCSFLRHIGSTTPTEERLSSLRWRGRSKYNGLDEGKCELGLPFAIDLLLFFYFFNCCLSKPWIRIRIHSKCWIRIHNTAPIYGISLTYRIHLKSGLLLGGGEGGLEGEQAGLLAQGRLPFALQLFSIKTLDPDPDSPEVLDSDPDPQHQRT